MNRKSTRARIAQVISILAILVAVAGIIQVVLQRKSANAKAQNSAELAAFADAELAFLNGAKKSAASIGETVIIPGVNIDFGNSNRVPLCIDENTLRSINKALSAKDDVVYSTLVQQDKIFYVSLETRVLIVAMSLDGRAVSVHVLEGPSKDRTGWIPRSWL